MKNIIERIARYADIDTRRAMGFGPRRLVLPDLDLPIYSDDYYSKGYTDFTEGNHRYIRFVNKRVDKLSYTHMDVTPDEIGWLFGGDDYETSRCYSFRRYDGLVSFFQVRMERYRHPDFNDDGSLKSWQSL
jgi:hypothetical protein